MLRRILESEYYVVFCAVNGVSTTSINLEHSFYTQIVVTNSLINDANYKKRHARTWGAFRSIMDFKGYLMLNVSNFMLCVFPSVTLIIDNVQEKNMER